MGRPRMVTVARWLLVFLLLFGVVGMHHVPPAAPGSSHMAEMPEHPGQPAHDLMHLCLAVLVAVGGLVFVAVLLSTLWTSAATPPRTWRHIARVDRPPGLGGRDLLSAVCVLRL